MIVRSYFPALRRCTTRSRPTWLNHESHVGVSRGNRVLLSSASTEPTQIDVEGGTTAAPRSQNVIQLTSEKYVFKALGVDSRSF